jgi:two-component system, OmpR family, response regulator
MRRANRMKRPTRIDLRTPEISHTDRRERVANRIDTMGVLVADNDSVVRRMLVTYLGKHRVRAVSASGRDDLMSQLIASEPALVVLDQHIGHCNGFDLLREIRSRSDVPIIMTSDDRCDETDRIISLELGADDHLTKPFNLRELLARIQAILRRCCAGQNAPGSYSKVGSCGFGGWQLDRQTRRLRNPRGDVVALTKGEYTLLLAFLRSPQRTLSREHLLQATRVHEDVFDRSVDVQIMRLRRKLQTDPDAPDVIKTERGFGYVFTLPVEEFARRSPPRLRMSSESKVSFGEHPI